MKIENWGLCDRGKKLWASVEDIPIDVREKMIRNT